MAYRSCITLWSAWSGTVWLWFFKRKRKGEASIHLGQYYYSANRPDKMLTYSISIERGFKGPGGAWILKKLPRKGIQKKLCINRAG